MRTFLAFAGVAALSFVTYAAVPPKTGTVVAKKKATKLFCPVAGPGRKITKDNCPSGYCSRRVNAKLSVAHGGGTIQFCCGGCKKVFAKNTAKFAAFANWQLAASGQAKQTACPFTGGPLGKTGAEVNGVKVSTCCGKCEAKLKGMKGVAQINAAFGAKAFKKGFKVAATKKDKK